MGSQPRAAPMGLQPRAAIALARECSGQMAVELAVLVPIIVVVALLAFNLLRFAELCARFDRVSLDAVLMQGVSPVGEPEELGGVEEVREALAEAMGEARCEVDVRIDSALDAHEGLTFDLAAGTTRFVCELAYRPWPSAVEVAGVGYQAPALLRHERTIVVDRFRAAVIT